MGQREIYAKGGITRWYWDYRDRAVLRHTENAKSVLDIGCGEGVTLEKINKQSRDRAAVAGIDADPRNVAACGNLPVSKGDVYELPRLSWDCCLLLDVIEHLDDPNKALRSIHGALAPGGKLIAMFPNDTLFFFARLVCLKIGAAFADYGHKGDFTPTVIRWAMEEVGFKIEATEHIPSSLFPLHYLIVARKT